MVPRKYFEGMIIDNTLLKKRLGYPNGDYTKAARWVFLCVLCNREWVGTINFPSRVTPKCPCNNKLIKYREGMQIGTDVLIKDLGHPDNKPFKTWLVQCFECGQERQAKILVRKKKEKVVTPRCKCKYKTLMEKGRIFGDLEIVDLLPDDKVRVKCIRCGREHDYAKSSLAGRKRKKIKGCRTCQDHRMNFRKVDRNKAVKLMYDHDYTLESIGSILGITRERVRQIVEREKELNA